MLHIPQSLPSLDCWPDRHPFVNLTLSCHSSSIRLSVGSAQSVCPSVPSVQMGQNPSSITRSPKVCQSKFKGWRLVGSIFDVHRPVNPARFGVWQGSHLEHYSQGVSMLSTGILRLLYSLHGHFSVLVGCSSAARILSWVLTYCFRVLSVW